MKKLSLILITCFGLTGCLKDDLFPSDYFSGPSEYEIEFLSGSFTGLTYKLTSHSQVDDHTNLVSKHIQKILSRPLLDDINKNVNSSSFLNFAWQGDTISGQFNAVFANDPSVPKSGDLQLILTNGDEFIASIPKGSIVDISSFGGPQGAIEGSINFNSDLDFRINGVNHRETASIAINFKIKRGPDQ